jgi:RNA 3'-terminal phosphate cyclase
MTSQVSGLYYFAQSIIVDVYFQVILLMAIAHGKSRVKCGPVTLHTETAIHIAHQLTEVGMIKCN